MSHVRNLNIIFGPPGTGKTTRCVDIIRQALERGVSPTAIALLTFSRAAAKEAKERVISKIATLKEDDLGNFRTIHSLAYARLELSRSRVMSKRHWREFQDATGMQFQSVLDDSTERVPGPTAKGIGDKCLRIIGLAAARRESLGTTWHKEMIDGVTLKTVEEFASKLSKFKASRDLVDFTDMLDIDTGHLEGIDTLVVDEGQDLTPQQWDYVRRLAKYVPNIYLAGDDDQGIYQWSGADPLGLLRFRGRVEVLPRSHRLSAPVHSLAESVARGIGVRQPKRWEPRGSDGRVVHVLGPDEVDLHNGSWLVLGRFRHQLDGLATECRRQGVPYVTPGGSSVREASVRAVLVYERLRTGGEASFSEIEKLMSFMGRPLPGRGSGTFSWLSLGLPESRPVWLEGMPHLSLEDREYIRDLRRRGYSLNDDGCVRVSTVHGSKGLEADNVLLLTDSSRLALSDRDAESRVAYVGITRARHNLFLVRQRGPLGWGISI